MLLYFSINMVKLKNVSLVEKNNMKQKEYKTVFVFFPQQLRFSLYEKVTTWFVMSFIWQLKLLPVCKITQNV